MFDLADRPLVFIPVKWTVLKPGEGADGEDALAVEVEVSVEVEVEVKDRDELLELFEDQFGDDLETEGALIEGKRLTGRELELKRFLAIVKRWRKVVNKGKALELNEDNARKMLLVPGFASAFQNAYLAACAGKADIRKGN